jgi:hypothetical protein
MKTITLLSCICLVAASCKMDVTYELSEQDRLAIEGMTIWLDRVEDYNDSLELCCDSAIACSDSLHQLYDDMLHYSEDMFESHHGQFSHDGDHCDHSHNGSGMMGYQMLGGGMHHHNSDDNHGDNDYHLMNKHDEMDAIIDAHCHSL